MRLSVKLLSAFACATLTACTTTPASQTAVAPQAAAAEPFVIAANPLAAQAGLNVLKRGGSAVDAAIVANATLGLMEPVSSGIGGDLFAIVYSAKENKLYGINGSGRSPLGLSYDAM